jgi:succinate dehydrogenase flavin-adding protein (antitoxin of CptAB toxin-antitoxin module)
VLPNKSAVVWERFLKENEILVYKFMIREIKKHLDSPEDRIDLFQFEDGSMYAWIPKRKVMDTLTKAMELFVTAEEYEYAAKVDALIKQYHINKLIKESSKTED